MRSLLRLTPVILLVLAASGCESGNGRIGPSGLPKGSITHVELFWLYDRGDETARNEVLAAGRKLERVPGVLSVVGGRVLASDRPEVDNSYDVAFVMVFRDEADLRRYRDDPAHLTIKKETLDRYAKNFKVYDFIAE